MISKNLKETATFARDFLRQLKPVESKQATTLALSGDLGSGKTTFVQFLAKALGIKEPITSPTFVIQKTYQITQPFPYKKLIHLDCYRINDLDEIKILHWDETLADPDNLIVIEWPERITPLLPADCLKINFKFVDEQTRGIEY